MTLRGRSLGDRVNGCGRGSFWACSRGWTCPVLSDSSSLRRWRSKQRAHRRLRWVVCSPQPGQVRQKDGSGRVQVAQSGSVRVPPWTRRTSPQPAQRARRCEQAWHHGLPVLLEIPAGGDRLQMEQVSVVAGRQVGHRRSVGGADGDGAASAAADARFQVGRVCDETGGAQRCSVLVAGGGLADDPAAPARLGAGLGDAVSAQPHLSRSTNYPGERSPRPQPWNKLSRRKDTSVKITKLATYPVPPRWLFLKIETDEGIVGWGEPVVEGRAATVAAAVEELSDYVIGKDPGNIEDIWTVLYRGGFYRGGPILLSAIAGIDQALWDIKGKALGRAGPRTARRQSAR